MANAVINNLSLRKNFSRIGKVADIPDLIEVQKKSYDQFLQADIKPEARVDRGLQAIFKGVFPIKAVSGDASLEFVEYRLGEPKYTVEECHQKGMTYSRPHTGSR